MPLIKPLRIGVCVSPLPKSAEGEAAPAAPDVRGAENALTQAIAALGHQPIVVVVDEHFADRVTRTSLDVAFMTSTDRRRQLGRAELTAVLEMNGVAVVGSPPAALSLCRDKWLAKQRVRTAGVASPASQLLVNKTDHLHPGLRMPVIVKPARGGRSRGISESSVVVQTQDVRRRAQALFESHGGPVLVEQYVPGRELTVAVLERQGRPRALRPLEIIFDDELRYPVYAERHKLQEEPAVGFVAPAQLPAALMQRVRSTAVAVHRALGCRDVSRVDLRLDARAEPQFLECNPLPRLEPAGEMGRIAAADGLEHQELISSLIDAALARTRPRRRVRLKTSTPRVSV